MSIERERFKQLVREFYSMKNSGIPDSRIFSKLRTIAQEEGYDLNEIYREIENDCKCNETVIGYANPINFEMAEALLMRFCCGYDKDERGKGMMNVRTARGEKYVERARNSVNKDYIEKAMHESMLHGLRIFYSKITTGKANQVNKIFYRRIKEIGIEKLGNYLNNGVSNDELETFLKLVYKSCYDFNQEHIGAPPKGNEDTNPHSLFFNYCGEKRIFRFYFNLPETEDAVNFAKEYQMKCQDLGLPYDMKLFKNMEATSNDTTVFYATLSDFKEKEAIIAELLDKYRNIGMGTPPIGCTTSTRLPGVGISHDGLNYEHHAETYNDYVARVAYAALIKVFAEEYSEIAPECKEYAEKYNDDFFSFRSPNKAGKSRDNSAPHKKELADKIKILLLDPSKKDEYVKKFMYAMQEIHNRYNGYSFDRSTPNKPQNYHNMAMEAFYIDHETRIRGKHRGDTIESEDVVSRIGRATRDIPVTKKREAKTILEKDIKKLELEGKGVSLDGE